MLQTNKSKPARIFSLLLATAIIISLFAVPVQAEEADTTDPTTSTPSMHADPAVFQKNYDLTPAQKKYAITEIQKVVSKIIKPEMSDLEKYYTLAVWENKHVRYDGNFWSGDYNMDLYRHQWDAYGVLTEKSVCVGMATLYANLCHAADLPCKVARLDPNKGLDHTINYIPNINDNAYYLDVTENMFLMSADTVFGESVDKEFAHVTKECTDHTFEYKDFEDDEGYTYYEPTDLKELWQNSVSYEQWFREYALHQDTEHNFQTEYVEKGSGLANTHYASYKDYDAQYGDSAPRNPGVWFMEDFYRDPEGITNKIRNKELDGQLLDIVGVEEVYECDSADWLAEDISGGIIVRYFPTMEDDNVILWETDIRAGKEYEVVCIPDGDPNTGSFDKTRGEAVVAIRGIGDYTGTYLLPVKIKKNNPMTLKAGTAKVKYSAVKKKAQTIKRSGVITVSKAQGAVTYKFVSALKGKKSFKKYFSINAKTGDVTVKKGLKKGTYQVKVKVQADGNTYYDASAEKTVTFKVRVA